MKISKVERNFFKKEDYQKQKAIGLATDLTAKIKPKDGGLYLKVGK